MNVTITTEAAPESLMQTRRSAGLLNQPAVRHSAHFEVVKPLSADETLQSLHLLSLAVSQGPSGPLQLPGLVPEASSVEAGPPEAAALPAVPPAPLAQKPPEKAAVEVDLEESAMVPAAAAGMLLWLIPALLNP